MMHFGALPPGPDGAVELSGQTSIASARRDCSTFAGPQRHRPHQPPYRLLLADLAALPRRCRVSAAPGETGSQFLVKKPGEDLLPAPLRFGCECGPVVEAWVDGSASRRKSCARRCRPGGSSEPSLRPTAAHRRLDPDLSHIHREVPNLQKIAQPSVTEQPSPQLACNSGLRQPVAVIEDAVGSHTVADAQPQELSVPQIPYSSCSITCHAGRIVWTSAVARAAAAAAV
jgi:hypothetical protein